MKIEINHLFSFDGKMEDIIVEDDSIREELRFSSKMKAYDGTPIIILTAEQIPKAFQTFRAGSYGFDTESDYRTGDLRILQIYDNHNVYIVFVKHMKLESTCPIARFLASKNRVKVGVDIEGDQRKLVIHYSKLKKEYFRQNRRRSSFSLNMNGFLDLQSLARINREPRLSLNKLSDKYVEDFISNPSKLGSYINPNKEEYIYAANDAILSLKICDGLIKKTPCQRWLNLVRDENWDWDKQKDLIRDWIISHIKDYIKSIESLARIISNSYKPWQLLFDETKRFELGHKILKELAEDGTFTHYDGEASTIGVFVPISSESDSDDIVTDVVIEFKDDENDYVMTDKEYNEVLEFYLSVVQNPEDVKKISSVINQLINSYGPWAKRFPSDRDTRTQLARDFINIMYIKGDATGIGSHQILLKTK